MVYIDHTERSFQMLSNLDSAECVLAVPAVNTQRNSQPAYISNSVTIIPPCKRYSYYWVSINGKQATQSSVYTALVRPKWL